MLHRRDLSVPRVGDAAPDIAGSAKALRITPWQPAPAGLPPRNGLFSLFEGTAMACLCWGHSDEEGADLAHQMLAICGVSEKCAVSGAYLGEAEVGEGL